MLRIYRSIMLCIPVFAWLLVGSCQPAGPEEGVFQQEPPAAPAAPTIKEEGVAADYDIDWAKTNGKVQFYMKDTFVASDWSAINITVRQVSVHTSATARDHATDWKSTSEQVTFNLLDTAKPVYLGQIDKDNVGLVKQVRFLIDEVELVPNDPLKCGGTANASLPEGGYLRVANRHVDFKPGTEGFALVFDLNPADRLVGSGCAFGLDPFVTLERVFALELLDNEGNGTVQDVSDLAVIPGLMVTDTEPDETDRSVDIEDTDEIKIEFSEDLDSSMTDGLLDRNIIVYRLNEDGDRTSSKLSADDIEIDGNEIKFQFDKCDLRDDRTEYEIWIGPEIRGESGALLEKSESIVFRTENENPDC